METLFDATIQALLARIQAGEASPADLNVARQMLKDNGISAVKQNKNLRDLTKEVAVDEDESLNDTPPAYPFSGRTAHTG